MRTVLQIKRISFFSLALGIAVMAFAADDQPTKVETIDGFRDTPMLPGSKWHLHDPDRPQPRIVTPGATFSQALRRLPMRRCSLMARISRNGKSVAAGTQPGRCKMAILKPGCGEQSGTRGKWSDFQLHVEWASPTPPRGTGQGRGNSGVLINGMYEVQVLDSYQAKTYPDGQAAAIYGQSPPLVNASKPPGQWQTYDIIFESPRWSEKGDLVKKAIVTVFHNGIVVQNRYELAGITDGITSEVPWKSLAKYPRPHPPEVFIALQDHNNPVRYRNIWVRTLGNRES